MILLESMSLYRNNYLNNFRCFVELCDYEPDVQHDLRLPVGESSGTLHLLLVISGLSCKEESDVLSGNLIKQAKIDFVSEIMEFF